MLFMIIGAGIAITCLFFGYTVGYKLGGRVRELSSNGTKPPICGCKHHFSMHAKQGKCMDKTIRGAYWDSCPCMKYIGPVPVTEIWIPPVISELERGK